MKKKKRVKTGGAALFDGIIFTSEYRQAIVENNGVRLTGKTISFSKNKGIIEHIPILRGIVGIGNQVSNATEDFTGSIDKNQKLNGNTTIFIYLMLIIICIIFPIVISAFFDIKYRNIVQFVCILLESLIYILTIKLATGMDKIFMYHGAEHKAVNTYEKLGAEGLTLENIRKSSRIHKRCGGNLVVYVVLFIMLSILFPIENLLLKSIFMILFSFFSVGIAYEIINIFSKLPKPLDIINYPACVIQLVTTKEPTDDMLEVARIGILASIREKDKTICEFVNECKKERKIENIQDIYSILEAVLFIDRDKIILNKNIYTINLTQELNAKYMLHRYLDEYYPLQYLTHKQYFFNEEYYVDENVLIPRSDTEILVEKAIEYINKENITNIIDLCCGSGAIGISIAKNVSLDKEMNVELIDISKGALEVSKKNILKNNVTDKVHTLYSDLLFEKIKQIKENEELKVDMIVSNPPYIKSKDMVTLDKNVKKEPHLALDGGEDGMNFYTRIVSEAKQVLKPNGLLLFEIGHDELEQMKKLIQENKEYKLLESIKDYGGNDRVVICRFQQKLEEKS